MSTHPYTRKVGRTVKVTVDTTGQELAPERARESITLKNASTATAMNYGYGYNPSTATGFELAAGEGITLKVNDRIWGITAGSSVVVNVDESYYSSE